MATATRSAWATLFPKAKNLHKTETESMVFMQRLTCISYSNILFWRKVLPPDHFEFRVFEGMPLRVLKSKSNLRENKTIGKWLGGAFEALEKKYLKDILLEIKDVKTESILEVHKMSYRYDDTTTTMALTSDKDLNTSFINDGKVTLSDVVLRTIAFLKNCLMVTKSCSDLPDGIMIGMRLSYHENTPYDYQPTGYKPCLEKGMTFAGKTRTLQIGTVETNHHFVSLYTKGCFVEKISKEGRKPLQEKKIEDDIHDESSDSENPLPPMLSSTPAQQVPVGGTQDTDVTFIEATEMSSEIQDVYQNLQRCVLGSQIISRRSIEVPNAGILAESNAASESDIIQDEVVKCICLSSSNSPMIVMCSGCSYWFHAECFGVSEKNSHMKNGFYCNGCHNTSENALCHDKILLNIGQAFQQQRLAVLRRILNHCRLSDLQTITIKRMEKVVGLSDEELLNFIKDKLVELGIAIPQQKKRTFLIDKCELFARMQEYFYETSNGEFIISSSQETVKLSQNKRRLEVMTPVSKRFKGFAENSGVSPMIIPEKRTDAFCKTPN